jgi:hypothetical protein
VVRRSYKDASKYRIFKSIQCDHAPHRGMQMVPSRHSMNAPMPSNEPPVKHTENGRNGSLSNNGGKMFIQSCFYLPHIQIRCDHARRGMQMTRCGIRESVWSVATPRLTMTHLIGVSQDPVLSFPLWRGHLNRRGHLYE